MKLHGEGHECSLLQHTEKFLQESGISSCQQTVCKPCPKKSIFKYLESRCCWSFDWNRVLWSNESYLLTCSRWVSGYHQRSDISDWHKILIKQKLPPFSLDVLLVAWWHYHSFDYYHLLSKHHTTYCYCNSFEVETECVHHISALI